MDADKLIKTMESDAVKFLTSKAMTGLTANVWSGFGNALIGGVTGYLVGLAVSVGITYGDWLTYLLINDWKTQKEAADYEKSIVKTDQAKTAKEKADAEQAQIDAFNRLVSLGSL